MQLNKLFERLPALGDFTLIRVMGEPGSEVLQARSRDGRDVVLRFWRSESELDARAAIEVATNACGVRHPMLASVFGAREHADGTLSLVSEYVPGRTLDSWIAEAGLPPLTMAVDFVRRLALGLHAAHQRGLSHHALYPGNIIVVEPDTKPNGRIVAKLLDLGVPRLMRPALRFEAAHFMAPEALVSELQAEGPPVASNVGTNVYSCGCLLHYLCTGQPPFQSESLEGLSALHAVGAIASPSRMRVRDDEEIPDNLARVIAHALEREPKRRVASAAALAASLSYVESVWRNSGVRRRSVAPPPPPAAKPQRSATLRPFPPPPALAKPERAAVPAFDLVLRTGAEAAPESRRSTTLTQPAVQPDRAIPAQVPMPPRRSTSEQAVVPVDRAAQSDAVRSRRSTSENPALPRPQNAAPAMRHEVSGASASREVPPVPPPAPTSAKQPAELKKSSQPGSKPPVRHRTMTMPAVTATQLMAAAGRDKSAKPEVAAAVIGSEGHVEQQPNPVSGTVAATPSAELPLGVARAEQSPAVVTEQTAREEPQRSSSPSAAPVSRPLARQTKAPPTLRPLPKSSSQVLPVVPPAARSETAPLAQPLASRSEASPSARPLASRTKTPPVLPPMPARLRSQVLPVVPPAARSETAPNLQPLASASASSSPARPPASGAESSRNVQPLASESESLSLARPPASGAESSRNVQPLACGTESSSLAQPLPLVSRGDSTPIAPLTGRPRALGWPFAAPVAAIAPHVSDSSSLPAAPSMFGATPGAGESVEAAATHPGRVTLPGYRVRGEAPPSFEHGATLRETPAAEPAIEPSALAKPVRQVTQKFPSLRAKLAKLIKRETDSSEASAEPVLAAPASSDVARTESVALIAAATSSAPEQRASEEAVDTIASSASVTAVETASAITGAEPPAQVEAASEIAVEPVVAVAAAVEAVSEVVVEPVVAEAVSVEAVSDAAVEPVVADAASVAAVSDVAVEPVVADAPAADVADEIVVEPVGVAASVETVIEAVVEPVVAATSIEAVVEPVVAEAVSIEAVSDAVVEPVVADAASVKAVVEPIVAEAASVEAVSDAMVEPVVAEAVSIEAVSDAVVEPVVAEAVSIEAVSDAVVEPLAADAASAIVADEIVVEPVVAAASVEAVSDVVVEPVVGEAASVAAVSDTVVEPVVADVTSVDVVHAVAVESEAAAPSSRDSVVELDVHAEATPLAAAETSPAIELDFFEDVTSVGESDAARRQDSDTAALETFASEPEAAPVELESVEALDVHAARIDDLDAPRELELQAAEAVTTLEDSSALEAAPMSDTESTATEDAIAAEPIAARPFVGPDAPSLRTTVTSWPRIIVTPVPVVAAIEAGPRLASPSLDQPSMFAGPGADELTSVTARAPSEAVQREVVVDIDLFTVQPDRAATDTHPAAPIDATVVVETDTSTDSLVLDSIAPTRSVPPPLPSGSSRRPFRSHDVASLLLGLTERSSLSPYEVLQRNSAVSPREDVVQHALQPRERSARRWPWVAAVGVGVGAYVSLLALVHTPAPAPHAASHSQATLPIGAVRAEGQAFPITPDWQPAVEASRDVPTENSMNVEVSPPSDHSIAPADASPKNNTRTASSEHAKLRHTERLLDSMQITREHREVAPRPVAERVIVSVPSPVIPRLTRESAAAPRPAPQVVAFGEIWSSPNVVSATELHPSKPAPRIAEPPAALASVSQPMAAARTEDLEVRGSLSDSTVRRAIERVRPQFNGCFVEHPPAAASAARVELTIDENGRARDAQVHGTSSSALDECLVQASRKIVVSAPDTGTVKVAWKLRYR